MKVRFLTDANFNYRIVEGLQRRHGEIDIVTADQAGLRGRSDDEVLAVAHREGRLLLTHDIATMPHHFGNRFLRGEPSSGVILVLQSTPVGRAIDGIGAIWEDEEAEDWIDRIGWLPEPSDSR